MFRRTIVAIAPRGGVSLGALCAVLVLCAPWVTGQGGQAMAQDMQAAMRTIAEMPAEERRQAMAAAARRGHDCAEDKATHHTLDTPGKERHREW